MGILEFSPNARIIVMVRNPIDMAHSLHSYLFNRFQEDVEDFDAAWELEALLDDRARRGTVDGTELQRLVAALDLAHDGLADGDQSAVAYVRGVIDRVEGLVADGRLDATDADEVIALAQAAIDMAVVEAVPDHPE